MKNPFSKLFDPLDYKPDWHSMSIPAKIRYIWDYFKLPIVVALILIYIVGYIGYRYVTRTDPILYVDAVNVVAGDALETALTTGYLAHRTDPEATRRDTVVFQNGLFLTADQTNSYFAAGQAAQVKIIAGITAGKLDVVLMNQEAFDSFSVNNYLVDLSQVPELQDLSEQFVENTAILEDNVSEVVLDASATYHAVTKEGAFGLNMSNSELFSGAGFSETVYLGIIVNSERMEEVYSYIHFLYS